MRTNPQIELLTELHRLPDEDARRSAFRRALADLAAQCAEQRPVPLEGLDPDELAAGVQAALSLGLLDDLSFLSPPAAATALYELATGLPRGPERKAIGALVLSQLHEGDGVTFAALSAALAHGSRDPFSDPRLSARVGLSMELPIGKQTQADALALALISRSHSQHRWLVAHATGSLSARRLASKLLERAAREAARRAARGDDVGLQVFELPAVQTAWERLLMDRESLVWRHVATARGLLSAAIGRLVSEIECDLDLALSPTEWRRAVVSLVAGIAVRPEAALRQCMRVLDGQLVERDRGLPGVMMYGLARAAEAEPRPAEALLGRLLASAGEVAMEELLLLLQEEVLGSAAVKAVATASARLQARIASAAESGSRVRVAEQQLSELCPPGDAAESSSLPGRLSAALSSLAENGPVVSGAAFQGLLHAAGERLSALEQCDDADHEASLLRELDLALLQRGAIERLVCLSEEPEAAQRQLDALLDRLTQWLLAREATPAPKGADIGLHMKRLVTLLHLVDGAGSEHSAAAQRRQLTTVRTLLGRMGEEKQSALGRVLCATLGRAFDALVREEVFEISDVILTAAKRVPTEEGLTTLAEASMVPPLEGALFAYAWLTATAADAGTSPAARREALDALAAFVRAVPVAGSPRVEALRQATARLLAALEALSSVPNLWGLIDGPHADDISALSEAVQALAQLTAGAARRWDPSAAPRERLSAAHVVHELWDALEQALAEDAGIPWESVLSPVREALRRELPAPLAMLIAAVLDALRSVSVHADPGQQRSLAPPAGPRRLPGWLPPSQTLGAFYVLDTLGEGAVGSVFIATRVEDRGRATAPQFALKVPAYDGQASGALSEEEFLDLFRREAGALLSLPKHPNLAGFVTFDAGARPKPVLVMEKVDGPSLARLLGRGRLSTALSFDLLDGVAAGLVAMHELGIGHLDVKPGNIIVNTGEDGVARAVLVDFGLSGRHLRPSCATTPYGAPEIWGLLPQPDYREPAPADVYAFACVVYETLTGADLFAAADEMATISAHIMHDGCPKPLAELQSDPALSEWVALLGEALRRDPRERLSMRDFRVRLKQLSKPLSKLAWPLGEKARTTHAA